MARETEGQNNPFAIQQNERATLRVASPNSEQRQVRRDTLLTLQSRRQVALPGYTLIDRVVPETRNSVTFQLADGSELNDIYDDPREFLKVFAELLIFSPTGTVTQAQWVDAIDDNLKIGGTISDRKFRNLRQTAQRNLRKQGYVLGNAENTPGAAGQYYLKKVITNADEDNVVVSLLGDVLKLETRNDTVPRDHLSITKITRGTEGDLELHLRETEGSEEKVIGNIPEEYAGILDVFFFLQNYTELYTYSSKNILLAHALIHKLDRQPFTPEELHRRILKLRSEILQPQNVNIRYVYNETIGMVEEHFYTFNNFYENPKRNTTSSTETEVTEEDEEEDWRKWAEEEQEN